jgi:hypothetical protein
MMVLAFTYLLLCIPANLRLNEEKIEENRGMEGLSTR